MYMKYRVSLQEPIKSTTHVSVCHARATTRVSMCHVHEIQSVKGQHQEHINSKTLSSQVKRDTTTVIIRFLVAPYALIFLEPIFELDKHICTFGPASKFVEFARKWEVRAGMGMIQDF